MSIKFKDNLNYLFNIYIKMDLAKRAMFAPREEFNNLKKFGEEKLKEYKEYGMEQINGVHTYGYNMLYDYLITDKTARLYDDFFDRYRNQTILDIGIGNCTPIIKVKDKFNKSNNKIRGIDIDNKYLTHGKDLLKTNNISDDLIHIEYGDICTYKSNEKYDVVYFSNSYAVIDDIDNALKNAISLLKENGELVISTTLDKEESPYRQKIKEYALFNFCLFWRTENI